jgi:type I restriction enzyme S subunit
MEKLPNNWIKTDLDTVILRMTNGSGLRQKEMPFDGSLPISRIETIWNETIDLDRVKYVSASDDDIKKYSLQKGDVLFSHINSDKHLGKTAVFNLDKTVIHGINLLLLRAIPQFNGDLLNYILRHYRFSGKFIEVAQRSVNQSSINQKKLKSFTVPLPPLAEQQRIVAKLDGLFGHLDSLKQRLELIPTLLKQFRQSVLTQAVTGKLTEEWREGKDLGEWENVILKDITIKIGSGSTPRGGSESYKNEGIPLVRSMNIRFNGIKLKGLAFIDEKQAERLKNVIIQENDILLNITGASIGRVCLAEKSIVGGRVNQHVTIIRLNEDDSPEYINMYLSSSLIQNYIFIENYGVTRQALTKTQTQNLKINLPPKEEQTEIVHRVENLFSKADIIEAAYDKLKQQIDSLPQAILAKAFKGELVEQLPTDGDAKDLLKEIAALRASLEKEKKSKKKNKINN